MLLTDEEMDKIIANVEDCNTRFGLIFAKAQHKKTVEWFIDEIEKFPIDDLCEGGGLVRIVYNKEWQAIKDKARK